MEPIPFVGRAGELGEFARAWDRVQNQRGGPVVATVTGPPGSGKSRLAATAIGGLSPEPAVVLRGGARLHSPAPYDWLASTLSHRQDSEGGEEHLEIAVPADALAWLRQDVAVPRERYAPEALLRIAVRVVRALAAAGPAVVVVEDLHALDPASLNLITALADTPMNALFLVTSRPDASPLVVDTLARLGGTPGSLRQHLGPLEPGDLARALAAVSGSEPAESLVASVYATTGGNPYALTELLATARSIDALTSGTAPVDAVPGAARSDAGAHPAPAETDIAEALTARELEVLRCLTAGMSNQQVASRLGISIRTVTVHVSNLLRKTRSRSRTDAALWAVRQRVPLPDQSSVTTTSS